MNLSDLTEVLHDRAELTDSSHEARMAGVRARVTATRRRRAAMGAAGVVLALVGIVYAVLPRPDRLPDPAVQTRSLPEYQSGYRLVAQSWGDLPTSGVTVRFVPRTLDLTLFTQCDAEQGHLAVTVTVNGRPMWERSGCSTTSTPADWAPLGVVVGQPSVVTLTVDGLQGEIVDGRPAVLPAPASGTFALGVGEAVPVNEYPFPPRPQTLATMSPHYPLPTIELRSDRADPVARKEFTIQWPGHNSLRAAMNTPGRMRVLVNDVQVVDFSHWSYTAGGVEVLSGWERTHGLEFAEGQDVRITVIPERVTGEWVVGLAPR